MGAVKNYLIELEELRDKIAEVRKDVSEHIGRLEKEVHRLRDRISELEGQAIANREYAEELENENAGLRDTIEELRDRG